MDSSKTVRPLWAIDTGDLVKHYDQILVVTDVGRSYGTMWVHLADPKTNLPRYYGVDISNLEWADESR